MPADPCLDLSLVLHADGRRTEFAGLLARGAKARRTQDGYRLAVTRRGRRLQLDVRRADGAPLDVARLEYHCWSTLGNYQQVIVPNSGRTYMDRQAAIYLRAGAYRVMAPDDGQPFLALIDQTGRVGLALGLVSWLRESSFTCREPKVAGRKGMVGGHDRLEFQIDAPSPGWTYGKVAALHEELFLGGGQPTWFHALREYAAAVRRVHRPRYPRRAGAWAPTWCSWTAFCSDGLSPERVLANARVARALGIGQIIIDDGWFGPGLDTDDAPLNIGDYHPDPAKFPDFPALVRAVQRLGVGVQLWQAPTCLAPAARDWARLAPLLMHHQGRPVAHPNGFYNLCPANPAARAHMLAETERMLREYGVDGFKVDLYNTLPDTPCDAPHAHDHDSMVAAVRTLERELWERTQAVRPGALLELKQNYGNVVSAQYGTCVRAGDAGYDTDTNLRRCCYLQAYAPVVHNDYLAVSVHEQPQQLAILLIKQMTGGVPTFSTDLEKMPARLRAVVRAWLAFYREHLAAFQGRRTPQGPALDVWEIRGRGGCIVSAVGHAAVVRVPARGPFLLLNATGNARLVLAAATPCRLAATVYDYRHRAVGRARLSLGDATVVAVPPGGYLAAE